ncbi:MAG TPA: cytochrome P450 [Terracidiphilus sp.]|jgi:hypothetical protein
MDPDFQPAPPTKAFFDADRGAWVISRYADVAAALRETALYQASTSTGEIFPSGEAETARSGVFLQVREELARIGAGQLRLQMQQAAEKITSNASAAGRVELVAKVVHPWCVEFLMHLGGGPIHLTENVSEMSAALLYKHANERSAAGPDEGVGGTRVDPEETIDRFLEGKELCVSKSMFVAVSTTLPGFLAKSLLALLRNPDQAARLLAEPRMMPSAIEELLRYAGIVHTLHRKPIRDIQLGGASIEKGQLVLLKVASANFDPEHFDDPYRLNLSRKAACQFALGSGLHACVGATLVREASMVLTPVFLVANPVLERGQTIDWMGDTTLKWPLSVLVRFERNRGK